MSSGMRAPALRLLRAAPQNGAASTLARAAGSSALLSEPIASSWRRPASNSHSPAPYRTSSRFIAFTPHLQYDAANEKLLYPVVRKGDHGEYQEYSVIHTNRSLNLMSKPFQQVMTDLNDLLKTTYNAHKVAIMPG